MSIPEALDDVILADAKVITLGGAGTIEDGYIRLKEGRITAVGTVGDLGPDDRARAESVKGHSIMPGLVNAHMHMHMLRPLYRSSPHDTPSLETMRCVRSLLNCFREGVTALRDMGHHDGVRQGVRDMLRQGVLLGPRVQTSGNALAMSFGHAHWVTNYGIKFTDELTAYVRQHIAEGADFIKVIASNEDLANPSHDGMTVPWMTENALREIVETAHLGHYMVCVHANGHETLRRCLAAGVDSIEHGIGLDKAQCAEMHERGIWLVPTLSQAKQAGDPEWGRPWWPRMRDMWHVCEQSIRIAVDQGVRMAAGTDVTGTMAEEVELLREAGMSAEDSLRAATINGAELMGLQNEIGTLDVGKAADVILVKGDPLASVDALRSVRRIYRNGLRLDRDVIDALVPAHPLWPSGS